MLRLFAFLLPCLGLLTAAASLPHDGAPPLLHQPDLRPLADPTRPVSALTRTGFTVQYFTVTPCESRVEVRDGEFPRSAYGSFLLGDARIVEGPPGKRQWHRVTVEGLAPGRRWFYRVSAPGETPSAADRRWGAEPPWRREQAVSTLSPAGRKTIVRLPVKVLLLPNVWNLESAFRERGAKVPAPPSMSREDLALIREQYAIAARFLWVNSGMRLWADFQIGVDDRPQRWGPEPAGAPPEVRNLPSCRTYSGEDFRGPGGGEYTLVDPRRLQTELRDPFPEHRPYACQIEQAFPRRWNPRSRQWEFYESGGGTLGADRYPEGFPARSQFLGGSDTAWLVCHEFHHQLEAIGDHSLSGREDDRVVFNHHSPRRRILRPDGREERQDWNSAGRHGEHWDGMAYWDRTLTDIQWLRFLFGDTVSVTDADNDGFPDDDARLPLDERRFGSDPTRRQTDGKLDDLSKVMLSTWAPRPLQPTWTRAPFQARSPRPRDPDSDGDGLPDTEDPAPLVASPPLIPPLTFPPAGDATGWEALPGAGELQVGGTRVLFRHAANVGAYAGLLTVRGPWRRVYVTLDGEGMGFFSGKGVLAFEATRSADRGTVSVRALEAPFAAPFRPGAASGAGLRLTADRAPDGADRLGFAVPNGGDGPWHWDRGGREVGVCVEVVLPDGQGYSLYEPYRAFYSRMVASVPAGPAERD